MITRKDLAPLDDASLENWRNDLKHRKDETLKDLYVFSRDFYAWPCRNHYNGVIIMTIHDILVNCGSVKSDSLVTILSIGGYKVKRQCFVKALESKYETLPFKTFTVSFIMWDNKPKLSIKFYV